MRSFGWLLLAGALLAGCSGGTSGGSSVVPLGPQVDGRVYAALRPPLMIARPGSIPYASQQTLLAGARVVAYAWPAGIQPLATATADSGGRFIFSNLFSNGLTNGATYRLEATDATHTLSAVITVSAAVATRNLSEATHIATLALRRDGVALPDTATLTRYEAAANKAIVSALALDGLVELTTTANSAAATAAGLAASAAAAGLTPAARRTLTNLVFTPSQLTYAGGNVQVTATLAAAAGSPTLWALAWPEGAAGLPTYLQLTATGNTYTGTLALPPNAAASEVRTSLAVAIDDGVYAPTPATVQTLVTQAEGTVVLDLLAETLLDEPASRGVGAIHRPAVRVIRGGARRARGRQVNANQSLRGASLVVDGVAGASGTTGNDGLLLLNVPMHYFDAGPVSITASLGTRVPYRQFLLLPPGLTLLNGDRVEIDIPLGKAADWTQVVQGYGLSAPDYAKAPVLGAFEVTTGVLLSGGTPAGTVFRPIATTTRTDDGDWFANNLAPGTVTLRGVFAPTSSATATLPFGPVTLPLVAGTVHGLTALLPPSGV